MSRPDTDTEVVDDPETSHTIPHGCIHADALIALARAVIKLDAWHGQRGGSIADRPCLRRLESSNGVVTAHISSGPAVGGSWEQLEFVRGTWEHKKERP